jgi:CBS domain-containing protein
MSKNQSEVQRNRISVDEVMTRDPASVAPDDTLNSAAHVMWTLDHGCLPVTDQDACVVGILTDRDIAMCSYTQGVPLQQLLVRLAMRHEVICARSGDDVELVDALMSANDVHRLPGIDNHGHLIGIVTRANLWPPTATFAERFNSPLGRELVITPMEHKPAAALGKQLSS